MKEYLGEKTTETSGDEEKIYYEKAFDAVGNGLLCGDTVKIISNQADQFEINKLGQEFKVMGIFQGDLMLDGLGYCWPHQVIKI